MIYKQFHGHDCFLKKMWCQIKTLVRTVLGTVWLFHRCLCFIYISILLLNKLVFYYYWRTCNWAILYFQLYFNTSTGIFDHVWYRMTQTSNVYHFKHVMHLPSYPFPDAISSTISLTLRTMNLYHSSFWGKKQAYWLFWWDPHEF